MPLSNRRISKVAEVLRRNRSEVGGWTMDQYLVWLHAPRKNKDIIKRGELYWVETQIETTAFKTTRYEPKFYDAAYHPVILFRYEEDELTILAAIGWQQ